MRIGSLVEQIHEQDIAGKRIHPLDSTQYYTVMTMCDGKFSDGWHPCIYLSEVGWKCAFRKSMFKEVQPPMEIHIEELQTQLVKT